MPKRDADLLIEDIETAIVRIEGYIAGLDRPTFLQDQKTIDAVVRNLEIIGEAVRWLPSDLKDRHGSVPWSQIAGLRNRIVHRLFRPRHGDRLAGAPSVFAGVQESTCRHSLVTAAGEDHKNESIRFPYRMAQDFKDVAPQSEIPPP